MATNVVCGIPCCLQNPKSQRVVDRVLRQIKDRFPQDFARLKDRIEMIRPQPEAKSAGGTMGQWFGKTFESVYHGAKNSCLTQEILRQWDECAHGILEIREVGCVTEDVFAANLAHELGHACTMLADIERRQSPSGVWGSEATADWYAFKWGFGKLIRITAKDRAPGHHGPLPGETIVEGAHTYSLSRNSVFHCVK